MSYTQVLVTVLGSAWSTLCILDRQARRDARKVARFVTCPQAIATYRALWQLLQIACLVAIACGASARILMERYIASCQAPDSAPQNTVPALLALPAPQPTPEIEDPWTVELPATPAPEVPAILALPPAPSLPLLPAAKPQRKPRAKKADTPKAARKSPKSTAPKAAPKAKAATRKQPA